MTFKPCFRTLAARMPDDRKGVTVEGWIHRRRQLSAVTFLIVARPFGALRRSRPTPTVRSIAGLLPKRPSSGSQVGRW